MRLVLVTLVPTVTADAAVWSPPQVVRPFLESCDVGRLVVTGAAAAWRDLDSSDVNGSRKHSLGPSDGR